MESSRLPGRCVPILRAGLGMLEGMTRLIPTAEVGFVGMVRNETTLVAPTYAERLPTDLTGRQCYLLDPMLATGGTLAAAVQFLVKRGADDITCICLLAAPEGIARLTELLDDLQVPCTLVVAGVDEKLTRSATSSLVSATRDRCTGGLKVVVVGNGSSGARLSGRVPALDASSVMYASRVDSRKHLLPDEAVVDRVERELQHPHRVGLLRRSAGPPSPADSSSACAPPG